MDDVERALVCARHLASLGLSPLPSKRDAKRPDLRSYAGAKLTHEPSVPSWHRRPSEISARFESPSKWDVPNIQVMTGVQTYGRVKVFVVDCDGEEAESTWDEIKSDHGGAPPTWTVRTGGGGLHEYYRIPGEEEVASGMVWGLWDTYRKSWAKHRLIEILGEGRLAVSPPSIHVTTGRRYEFAGIGPKQMPLPAESPRWILDLPRLKPPDFRDNQEKPQERRRVEWRGAPGSAGRGDVLDAISDKRALAESWGLKFGASQPNRAGWIACHTDPDDRNPSGSFHPGQGIYKDMRSGKVSSLFDLGVELGAFSTWLDCLRWCEHEFLGAR